MAAGNAPSGEPNFDELAFINHHANKKSGT
jgi:hypothetical protein